MQAAIYVRSAPGWMTWIMRHFLSNWVAITLGRSIFVARDLTADEMRHELVHVAQWEQYGLSFIPRYLWALLLHGYHDNPYEIEARGT